MFGGFVLDYLEGLVANCSKVWEVICDDFEFGLCCLPCGLDVELRINAVRGIHGTKLIEILDLGVLRNWCWLGESLGLKLAVTSKVESVAIWDQRRSWNPWYEAHRNLGFRCAAKLVLAWRITGLKLAVTSKVESLQFGHLRRRHGESGLSSLASVAGCDGVYSLLDRVTYHLLHLPEEPPSVPALVWCPAQDCDDHVVLHGPLLWISGHPPSPLRVNKRSPPCSLR
ncbi:hypothetical protein Droror1_Dr00008520 [Drosera rotundifolia]